MADNIVVTYKDNLDEFIKQLKVVSAQNTALGKQVEDTGKKTEAANKKASESTTTLGNKFDALGRTIAAAFSVTAIIAFGKASIEAFAEAELSVRKLNSALSAQGGTQAQLKTLLDQSKQLQKTTIFSDEQIQAAQTLAVQFGLTATEVEKLIPIIVDFASATGQDLQSALEAVLRGSEGVARGLKVYGIEVETTGTRSQKLTQITDQLTQKFGGQAQQVGETTTGSFKRLKNAFNDLEESIGAILAKGGGFIDFLGDVVEGLNRFFKTEEDVKREDFEFISSKAKESALKNLEELRTKLIASGRDGNDAFRILISESNTIITEKRKQLNATWDTQTKDAIREQIKLEEARIQALEDVQNDEKKIRERGAKEGLEAASKAAKEARDAQIKDAKETADAKKALQEFTFQSFEDNITDETNALKLQAAETITNKEQLETRVTEIELEELQKRRANRIEFGKSTSDIDKQIADKTLSITLKGFDENTKQRDAQVQDYLKWQQDQVKITEDAEKKKQELIQETFDLGQSLLDSISELQLSNTDEDLERVNNLRDVRLDAIDAQIAALEEANDRGRISDKKLEAEKKRLVADRVATEKRAAEEERKLKVKQAEQDKLLSIFKIGLLLAEAIASGNVFRAIAAGIQLAVVIAKPIPQFARGTKGKKEPGVGMVGEEGREFLWMPQGAKVVPHSQTEKYKAAIDSMIDNNFEQYVYKAMIAPALREATRKMERDRQKSFAENVANSFNVKAEVDPYRLADGIKSNNKELAYMIGTVVAKQINNGYKNPRYH